MSWPESNVVLSSVIVYDGKVALFYQIHQKRRRPKKGQIIYCSKCFLYHNALEQLAVVRNCAHDLAPQLPSNKSKKTSNFLQLFCWKLYRNFFSFFFLKELFLVEIENLLRISKENREKARTEIKIQGNPIKNEFGNIWVGFRKWKLLANSAIQDILILSWAV